MSEPLEGWRERAKQDMARVSWSEKKPNGSEIPVLGFRISIGTVLCLSYDMVLVFELDKMDLKN